jgi:hypothetical protein
MHTLECKKHSYITNYASKTSFISSKKDIKSLGYDWMSLF